ncbi:hypothetical protein ACOMHN_046747 [Nucella lapillus]
MDWQYRGEGNCSLVVADSVKNKVYRLLKQNYTKKFADTADSQSKAQTIYSELQQVISYTRWVMQPLLSPNYVVLPKLITVDEQFVASIVKHTSCQRPARRLQKAGDRVDEESMSALVLPDFCFVPDTSQSWRNAPCPPVTLSIEIKDGEDVYSAETKENLEDILHSWFDNPSVTKNRAVNVFLDMVIEILLMSVSPDDPQPHSDLTRSPTLQRCESSSFMYSKGASPTCQWLPEGCVLERVYAAQLLDDLDVLGVYPLYQQLINHLHKDPKLWSEWGFDGHFPQNWLLDSAAFGALTEDSLDWKVQKVKRFLVSKTLQDCSIMVAVRPLTNREVQQNSSGSNHGNNLLQFGGRWHKVSVALVDLDPKPLDKIPTYHRQASAIKQSFQEATFPSSNPSPSPSASTSTSPSSSPSSSSSDDKENQPSCASRSVPSCGVTLTCSDLKARKQGQTDLL